MKPTKGQFAFIIISLVIVWFWYVNSQTCVQEWTSFLYFKGNTYKYVGEIADSILIESKFAQIQRELSELGCDDFELMDGDASLLPVGTQLYTVRGYAPFFRLATLSDNVIELYEVVSSDTAQLGAEIVDIEGKVERIDIVYYDDLVDAQDPYVEPRYLGVISNTQQMENVVRLILNAPVGEFQLICVGETVYALVFLLNDGTNFRMLYWLEQNRLQFDLKPPPEFASIVQEFLRGEDMPERC